MKKYSTPTGDQSVIAAFKTERGIDLTFGRDKPGGEIIIHLTEKQASDLATNIIAAIADEGNEP